MFVVPLLVAAATEAFVCNDGSAQARRTVTMQIPPQNSGWVADEEEANRMFNPWPETYVPDPKYRGSCPPGLGRENTPLEELSMEVHQEDFAFFEIPFHLRLPSNHPYLLGPYDRLEIAGRFVDDHVIERASRKAREKEPSLIEKVEKLEGFGEVEDDTTDKDPLFDDQSSVLLDAALGLDEDGGAQKPPKKRPGAPRKKRGGSQKKIKPSREDENPPPPPTDDDDFLFD